MKDVAPEEKAALSWIGWSNSIEDKWVGAQKVSALGTKMAPSDLEHQIYVLRELNGFFRDVPTRAYDTLDGRTRLLDASQDALDQAIEREENEE